MAGHQGTSTRHSMDETLARLVESERHNINTTLPGVVVAYDAKRQKATIQPRLKSKIGDQEVRAPELLEVPVAHPRAGGFVMHKPLKKGDEVILQFAQRSLDQSGDDASDVDGAPGRMHDLSDAIAMPASYSKPAELSNMPEKGVYLGTADGKNGLTISEGGKVDFKQEGDSLFKVILAFMETIRDHTNAGDAFDQAGDVAAQIDRLKKLME